MEKLQKEIEDILLKDFYTPLWDLFTKGITPNIRSAPIVAKEIMNLMTALPNYGDEEDKYCSQELDLKNVKQIGKAIKFYRKKKKLTQSELAESIGMSLSSIQKYETENRNIDVNSIIRIAKVLEVSVNNLLSFGSGEVVK